MLRDDLQKTAIRLRPVQEEDEPFLYALYVTTREKEMAVTNWNEDQITAFLQQQHTSQLSHYCERFPQAQHQIILFEGQPTGRIYINRSDHEIRVLDVTIHPDYRNQGIGTFLMQELLAEAQTTQLPVRLYVWQLNFDAQRWYQALGFSQIDTIQVYHHLEWQPAAA